MKDSAKTTHVMCCWRQRASSAHIVWLSFGAIKKKLKKKKSGSVRYFFGQEKWLEVDNRTINKTACREIIMYKQYAAYCVLLPAQVLMSSSRLITAYVSIVCRQK